MDAGTVAESMQGNAMGTLTDVLDGIKDLDIEDQAAAISQLFGEEAAPHVQKLIKDTKTLQKIKEDALNADSQSVKKEYDEIAATNAAKYERTSNALSNFAVVMGDRLLPILDPLREGFTEGVIAATEFLSANEGVGTAIAAGAMLAVTAVGAYKAYQAVKFAKGLAGIAKETFALKKAQSATDKHTAALERNARASSKAASSANEQGGSRRRSRSRSRTRTPRTRMGKRNRLGNLLSGGLEMLTGGFDSAPDRAPRRTSRRRKGGLLALGAGLLAGGASMPSFAGGMDGAADAAGAATDVAEALPFAKAAKAARVFRPVAMAIDGVSAVSSLAKGDYRAASETGGGFLGGMGGAALGGMIGSFVLPGIGTAIGAALGGLAGDMAGGEVGGGLFDWMTSPEDKPAQQAAETSLADKQQSPSQPDIKQSPLSRQQQRRKERRQAKFNEQMSLHPNYGHLAAEVKKPSAWYSKAKLATPTEAIKTAQAKEAQARQTPNQTFAPQIIIQASDTPEATAQLTMEKVRELWDEWQRERDERMTQDIAHSLVT